MKKTNREVDKNYLKFIRTQPCLVCGITPSQAHHTISRGAGGSDYMAVSLCPEHHAECHSIGKKTFQNQRWLAFEYEIIRLLIQYIKMG